MSAAASDGGDDAPTQWKNATYYYYSREEEEDDDDDDTNNNNTNNNAKTTTKTTTKTLESKYSTTNRVPALMYTLGYLIFSTITVVSNKHLIKDAGFGNPIFVSSCGTAFACVASAILVHGKLVEITEPRMTMERIDESVRPGGSFSSTRSVRELVYVYLSLSFVQMLKAFVPVVTYATHVCVGTDKYNSDFTVSLLAMVVGGVMCMNVSGKATAIGVSVMFGSHFAEAIRTVGAQWLLVNRKFGVIEIMYYCPMTVVFFIPLVYYLKAKLQSREYRTWRRSIGICLSFLFVMLNACGLGVVKNMPCGLKASSTSQTSCCFSDRLYGDG